MRAMGKVLLDLKQFVGPEDVSEFGGDSLWYSVGEFSVLSIDSSHDTISYHHPSIPWQHIKKD